MKNKIPLLLLSVLFFWGLNNLASAQVDNDKVLINTTVVDFKQKVRPGETVMFVNTVTGEVFSKISDKEGKCFFVLIKGKEYLIKYKNFGKDVDYQKVQIPDVARLKELKVLVKFQPATAYTLDNVLFETGKANLKNSSYKAIDELADAMKAKNTMEIEIAGHTDNIGDKAANLKLSQERAEAVRHYLIKKGIDAHRITAKGYGDTKPVADNSTNAGKQQNRRTEVKITKE
ncbi:outer membrane protein/peptidoglycan-associated (lipo)protein [Bernardetia litoralis DSM 6794]|uniref:Outer membrane protein/peptidoglycan-associated (Lipo)protein n=1 Tax=Bernardetia litoralis (strain ATCC 23117 / DSM 6794 / NBRC 15988 / NCIMB 1366 / Fx l1 / Sio-4) TaxID=880071 RepID=I4AH61_BERLS|nr:OmpA family protein [Bernardetia litoralis]AFM03296.1 outer membrane protein/peptidoglycan-associated (lipo)protein [Bernardetia litoralis DSM 6794]